MSKKRQSKNYPPLHGIRVPAEAMSSFVAAAFERAGASVEDAGIMAKLLVETDLRCVFSHGTRQTPGYVRQMLSGGVNPRPEIKVVSESPGTLALDGDGGMGHLPCHLGTLQAIAKARECGVAAVTTRNHFHFGAAGKYSRMALAEDCIGISMSSNRIFPNPKNVVFNAAVGSPISVAIPAGNQPPLVLDMAASIVPYSPEFFEQFPTSVFKGLGLCSVVVALGGIFAGIYSPEFQPPRSKWISNQGAFIVVVNVGHFMPIEELKEEMDRYIGDARSMKPFPGEERAELAGGWEWEWERENRVNGIPVSPDHQKALEDIAAELGIESPFPHYEDTRF